MHAVATFAAPWLSVAQRRCRAQKPSAVTSTTPLSSSTTHQPLTANRVELVDVQPSPEPHSEPW
jgi:hypothetical protein